MYEREDPMADAEYVVVLTTLPLTEDAADFGRTLVLERLAACVTVLAEVQAVYRWEGEVCEDRERQLIIKTTRDRLEALEQRVRALHPYQVPEFLAVPVTYGSGAYLAWLRDSTRS